MRAFLGICLAAVVSATLLGSSQHAAGMPEKLTAFAVSLGGPRTPAGTAIVDITIDRWSTDAERQQFMQAFKKGQDALLDTLRDLRPVGSIRTPDTLAYDLRYANQVSDENGDRRIFLATDRPIGFWEIRSGSRSLDYPFTFIELRMNEKGEGEGKIAVATKLEASKDGQYVELENYGIAPVQLSQVKRR